MVDIAGEATGSALTIERSRPYHREWLLKFAGLDHRDGLEAFRSGFLAVPASEATPLADGEVYLHELDGFAVRLEDGTPVGLVTGHVRDAERTGDRGAGAKAGVPAAVPQGVRAAGGSGGKAARDRAARRVARWVRRCASTSSPSSPRCSALARGVEHPGGQRRRAGSSSSWCSSGTSPTTATTRWTTMPSAAAPGWCSSRSRSSRRWSRSGRRRARWCSSRRGGGASATPTRSGGRWRRELTLLCGHYKDVDQRVAEQLATEEVSLGDFVLSGGEPAALAVARRGGAAPAGRPRRSRVRQHGLALRRAAEPAELYQAAGVSGGMRCRRCFAPATTRRSPRGGRTEAERLTRERRPDLWQAHVASQD